MTDTSLSERSRLLVRGSEMDRSLPTAGGADVGFSSELSKLRSGYGEK